MPIVRNVNEALDKLLINLRADIYWRDISPRGLRTLEWKEGPYITTYLRPRERVLFHPERDANPFFHFFESLWILAGRSDVDFLARYNPRMREYSDNGVTFHAPYGWRLRHHFARVGDQLVKAIEMLRHDQDSRQVVMSIWDPETDLGATTKDMPCNDLIMLKIRDGALNMTVCCRSNDAIWGAYGANAVQFSMIQEFIARAVGVDVGIYTQVSDSMHVYTDNEAVLKTMRAGPQLTDPYANGGMRPYPILNGTPYLTWLRQLDEFLSSEFGRDFHSFDQFFYDVALPMRDAWGMYKDGPQAPAKWDKNTRINVACDILEERCIAVDWMTAGVEWLNRRREKK